MGQMVWFNEVDDMVFGGVDDMVFGAVDDMVSVGHMIWFKWDRLCNFYGTYDMV